MIKLLSLAVLVTCAACIHVVEDDESAKKEKIVGGDYAKITDIPHQAQILLDGSLICGGSIIDERWILTAAHCMGETKGLSILTGSTHQAKKGQKHKIEEVIVHEDYNQNTIDNDIALIKVSKPIEVDENQRPIGISTRAPKTGQTMEISGFGKEAEDLPDSKVVKLATVTVVEQSECRKAYRSEGGITDNMFCAGKGFTDSCQGDSGGPGVINGKLAGIVSFGLGCADPLYPGVYTRVHKYRRWISTNTGLKF